MNDNRLIVFELSGEYGHFRKFNATTSPLTYPIPTRTALTGILGAVLGLERETAHGVFTDNTLAIQEVFRGDACQLAVQLLSPVKKVNIGFNLLDTGNSFYEIHKSGRTQIEYELLKNPTFRVFVQHNDSALFDRLAKKLIDRSHHFTPYLGLSQFTALLDKAQVTSGTVRTATTGYVPVQSAVNLSLLKTATPVEFDPTNRYNVETMPMELSRDRVITRYGEVLVNARGGTVLVRADEWVETPDFGNILFL